jgi:methyl-accepting chemotaxis protein
LIEAADAVKADRDRLQAELDRAGSEAGTLRLAREELGQANVELLQRVSDQAAELDALKAELAQAKADIERLAGELQAAKAAAPKKK